MWLWLAGASDPKDAWKNHCIWHTFWQQFFFKIWMACSAVLRQWVQGVTNWKLTSFFFRNNLNSVEASLSKIFSSGLKPASLSFVYTHLHSSRRDAPVLFFRAWQRLHLVCMRSPPLHTGFLCWNGEGRAQFDPWTIFFYFLWLDNEWNGLCSL